MAWTKKKQGEYIRSYYARNRERILENNRKWREKNKEKHLAKAREYHWKNRERLLPLKRERAKQEKEVRAHKLRLRKYGITREQFLAMVHSQNGICAACGAAPAAVVDHDHETGVVRSLLCSPCNTSLGLLKEDEGRIIALLRYVSKHKAKADAA